MAQLCQYSSELKTLQVQVVVISFGSTFGAQAWLDETRWIEPAEINARFTLLLDPSRAAYTAYGLEHSLARSWRPKVWLEYARLMLSGRKWRGIQGDSGQLGGDFIVDSNGVIRFAYRSDDPTDRPSMSQLLATLEGIAKPSQ